MAGSLKHLLRHSSIYLLGNLLNRLGAFLLLPLYTNLLTPSEYGSLEILYSLTSVMAVLLGAGLSHATLRFYFDYSEQHERNRVIITNLLVSSVFAIAGCLLAFAFDESLTLLLLDDINYLHAFQLALLVIFFELTAEVLFAYIRAQERSVFFVVVSACRLAVQLAATWYFLAHLDRGVEGVLNANLFSVLVTWLGLGVLTVRECGLRTDRRIIKPILHYSLPFAVSALILSVQSNADRFILKEFAGFAEVGLYGLALRFALLLRFLLVEPLSKSYGPYRFSLIGKPGAEQFHAAVGKYLTAAAVFVALGLSLFASDVLKLMSAEEFWPAAGLIPILSVGVIGQALLYCFQTGIMIQKQTRLIMYVAIASTGCNLILIITLIPTFGAYGAAFANALTMAFTVWLTNRVSQKLYQVPYPFMAMAKMFTAAVLIYLVSLLLPEMHWLLGIAVKSLLALSFAAIVIWMDRDIRHAAMVLRNKLRPVPQLTHASVGAAAVDSATAMAAGADDAPARGAASQPPASAPASPAASERAQHSSEHTGRPAPADANTDNSPTETGMSNIHSPSSAATATDGDTPRDRSTQASREERRPASASDKGDRGERPQREKRESSTPDGAKDRASQTPQKKRRPPKPGDKQDVDILL